MTYAAASGLSSPVSTFFWSLSVRSTTSVWFFSTSFLGGQLLIGQVTLLLPGVCLGIVEMAVDTRDGNPHLQLGAFAHLLEFFALILVELTQPLRVAHDALDGQIALRHRDHSAGS